jgi:hypothetical protein
LVDVCRVAVVVFGFDPFSLIKGPRSQLIEY